jgi:hypothetical protein
MKEVLDELKSEGLYYYTKKTEKAEKVKDKK